MKKEELMKERVMRDRIRMCMSEVVNESSVSFSFVSLRCFLVT